MELIEHDIDKMKKHKLSRELTALACLETMLAIHREVVNYCIDGNKEHFECKKQYKKECIKCKEQHKKECIDQSKELETEQIEYKKERKKICSKRIKKYKTIDQIISAAATTLALRTLYKITIISKKPTKTLPKPQPKISPFATYHKIESKTTPIPILQTNTNIPSI